MESAMKTYELLAACLALLLSALCGSAVASDRSTLSGRVILPPNRSGPATVLIQWVDRRPETPMSVAAPRLPPPKRTDEGGRFQFESLDTAWLYHLVVLAPGCRPASLNRVDPAVGPATVELKAADVTRVPPGTVLRGRVLDPRGRPVPGAIIRLNGVTRGGSTSFPPPDVDKLSVSDNTGAFVLLADNPFTAAEGAVEASGLATALFENWRPDGTAHELTLVDGACLQGRLLQAGKPVANAEVRLDNFGAESGSTFWQYSALTDDGGGFFFANLPTNRSCSLYGTMSSLADRGAISKQRVSIRENNSTNDLGDLNLSPSFKVAGRIRLSDGKPVSTNAYLTLRRRDMVGTQDSLLCATGPDGAFRFIGVPAEPIQLLLRVPGYQLTPRDRLLMAGSSTNLDIVADMTNLVIEMRPQTPSGS